MKFTIAATTLSVALASAFPQKNAQVAMPDDIHAWHPAGINDLRGPCPMMNTLANHGFIPRNGGNITKQNAIKGLADGLNFDASLASLMWDQAIIANPEPNATFFTLEHLNQHNVLEHDASLSRMDAYYGNNHIESRAFNPNYTFTANNEQFSLGEVAAPFIAFGNTTSVTVPRDLVLYFFEHERLPHELGWSKKNETMTLKDILNVVSSIRNATSLLTPESASNQTADGESHGIPEGAQVARRSLHLPVGA
ncbi:Cloroperoxidase [Aureobasidium pullulans]|uniref:Cloroperoxidase n=1 Tax=Aureobasidium pullulans TaxID=5580 RepID=A0A4S8YWT5_AURPU|nr:Cloroperoxidase [Aureobasidium pullulans]